MEAVIKAKNISKVFRENAGEELHVLEKVNLEIFPGEIFMLLGPSGSGKSTIMRILSGLEKEYGGQVLYGSGVSPKNFAFVFQQFALMPWLTVEENINFGLVSENLEESEKKDRVKRELKRMGLHNFARSYPKELSGGMRQRVGIARALAINPKIIFMDEPFSELDSFTAEELRKEMLDIWHDQKITIIQVSHIIEEALELADRIAVLTPRPGRIEKIVENKLSRPRKKRSEDFYKLDDELYKLIKP